MAFLKKNTVWIFSMALPLELFTSIGEAMENIHSSGNDVI